MARQRIPETISPFNSYIINTANRLAAINPDTGNPYWQDFKLNNAQQLSWQARRTEWVNTIFPEYSNPATRTRVGTLTLKHFMKQFNAFAGPLLKKIAASGIAGVDDELTFRFVVRRKNPTHKVMPIPEPCSAAIQMLGGGRLEIRCKTGSEERRARIPKEAGADTLLYCMKVGAGNLPVPAAEDWSMKQHVSTKAHFDLDLGTEAQGQWLYIYFKWYNTRKPHLAGPWSQGYKVAVG